MLWVQRELKKLKEKSDLCKHILKKDDKLLKVGT